MINFDISKRKITANFIDFDDFVEITKNKLNEFNLIKNKLKLKEISDFILENDTIITDENIPVNSENKTIIFIDNKMFEVQKINDGEYKIDTDVKKIEYLNSIKHELNLKIIDDEYERTKILNFISDNSAKKIKINDEMKPINIKKETQKIIEKEIKFDPEKQEPPLKYELTTIEKMVEIKNIMSVDKDKIKLTDEFNIGDELLINDKIVKILDKKDDIYLVDTELNLFDSANFQKEYENVENSLILTEEKPLKINLDLEEAKYESEEKLNTDYIIEFDLITAGAWQKYDKVSVYVNGVKVEEYQKEIVYYQFKYDIRFTYSCWGNSYSNPRLSALLDKNKNEIDSEKIEKTEYKSILDMKTCKKEKFNVLYKNSFKIVLKQNSEIVKSIQENKKIEVEFKINDKVLHYKINADEILDCRGYCGNVHSKITKEKLTNRFVILKNLKIYSENYQVIPKIYRLPKNQILIYDERNHFKEQEIEKINLIPELIKNKEVKVEYKSQWQPSYRYKIRVLKEKEDTFKSLKIKFKTKTLFDE